MIPSPGRIPYKILLVIENSCRRGGVTSVKESTFRMDSEVEGENDVGPSPKKRSPDP